MGIIDVHGHLGEWFFPIPRYSLDDVETALARYGIDRGIFSSALAVIYDFRDGNRWLADHIAGRERLLGYVTVNPHYPDDSRRDLDAYLPRPEFAGVKYHTHYTRSRADSDDALGLLADVATRDVPVLLHASADSIAGVAQALPALRVIMPHFNAAAADAPRLKPLANVWVDFCGTDAHRGRVAEAVALLGHTRVLFGTDFTLIDPARALGMMADAGLPEAQSDGIFRHNAETLFGLG